MYHVVLTACLISAPEACESRLLPAGDAPDLQACIAGAETIARDWLARHPDLSAQGQDCVPTQDLAALELAEIADGVWLHQGAAGQISAENRGWIANLGVVIGDSIAVIDPGASRAQGEALYAAIRQHSDRPVSHVILTHMHPDHILGAEVFAEAGARVTANARLPDALALRGESWLRSIPDQIGTGALAGTRLVAVDITIGARQVIDLGARDLILTPVPPAHTDNDMTVLDSATGTLFTGDLVFQGGLTPSIDGSLSGWLDWIDLGPPQGPDGAPPRLIVPGHGPVSDSWDAATAPGRRYLDRLRATIRDQIAQGAALSAAIPETVAAMQDLAPEWLDFDAVTARNAATAYAELEWE
ncbi:quinoprotein relay system zinc metallohydrolase 2 [Paracoccus sp. DMF-8]|uniref:quinoprotein relay system zinc metallohydrolase 2 n=1 Tax=Paracoccus sp. DMF-8 TaxID=3019445 RepID=UPI0023E7680D|nr:quinoprotein relay system zinc metallohydrolase 2 [Paracoccus sp. DMF-8]MDF3606809.1 quinoprotein relay system zinc metallohydrolase 2 [Paracoccus sp. DMF-8]